MLRQLLSMNRTLVVSAYASLLVLADQLSKAWVMATFALGESRPVIPGVFNLTYVQNKGAAFGFMNTDATDLQRPFLIVASFAAVGLALYLAKTAKRQGPMLLNGLSLLLGGAVGNLIDRIRLGVVVDFLDFYMGTHHWPAFNIADCAISIGAACLAFSLFREKKDDPAPR